MKVKSLLLDAAAFVALGASAQSVATDVDDIVIDETNVNQMIEMPLILTMPEGDNFTNIQFTLHFPEGVKPYELFVDGESLGFGYGGDDIATYKEGRNTVPSVAFSDNFYVPEFWPEYTVFGVNMIKIANETNPYHFYTVQIIADESVKTGASMGIYVKYTRYDDVAREFGTDTEFVPFVTFTNNLATAVKDVNAAKAISSVKYMNAAGMVSDTAFDGVNIVVTKYADGTQSTAKVVK